MRWLLLLALLAGTANAQGGGYNDPPSTINSANVTGTPTQVGYFGADGGLTGEPAFTWGADNDTLSISGTGVFNSTLNNEYVGILVTNSGTTTGARSAISVGNNNAVQTVNLSMPSTAFATSGPFEAGYGILRSSANSSGLKVGTGGSNKPLIFFTTDTARGRWNDTGLSLGTGTITATTTLDVYGVISATSISGTNAVNSRNISGSVITGGIISATNALNARLISVTNIIYNSSTALAGQGLYLRSNPSGGGLLVDSASGNCYNPATNNSLFASTDIPANCQPSATVVVSGTLRVTSWTTLNADVTATTPLDVYGIVSSTGIYVNGDISYTGSIADVSDRRMKHDIEPLPDGMLEKVMLLKPSSFVMNDSQRTEWGFVAQDVEALLPQLVVTYNVVTGQGLFGGDIVEDRKSIKPLELIPVLAKALQEETARRVQLQGEVDGLKARVDALEQSAP